MADITEKISISNVAKLIIACSTIFGVCYSLAKLQLQVNVNTETIAKVVEKLDGIHTEVIILKEKVNK